MAFRISISKSFVAALGFAAGCGIALAQDNSLDQTVPVAPKKEVTLDELYAKLARQTNPVKATRTERLIRAKQNDSGSATINLMMSWSAQALIKNDYPKALDILEHVTVLDPDFAEAWNRRAFIYYNKKDFSRSLADIRRTLELDPRHIGAMTALASILQTMDKDRLALDAWYEVLAIYPANQTAQKSVIDLEEKLADKGA